MARYLWLADSAVTVEFGNDVSPDIHRQVRAFAAAVEASPPAGFRELVPTYRSVTVHLDPTHPAIGQAEAELREAERRAEVVDLEPGRVHRLAVKYGGDDGPDLEEVARLHDLTPEQVVALHSGREYLVYCVGFSPGFALLGGLPEELHTPRLPTPRKLVPGGTVALGGQQTGVYPVPTPGGWRLLGRTNFTFFDVNASPPCPIALGDRVVFEAVDDLPAGENVRMDVAAEPVGEPSLEVVKPGLFTTVQDLGRWGYQASGVSVAGAMDPVALRAANVLVGNLEDGAGLEITLTGGTLRAVRPCTVALAGAPLEPRLNGSRVPFGESLELAKGDELDLGRTTAGARAYLALAGGIDVPVVLGSRSTYTRAGFGGMHGRALQAGDVLAPDAGRARQPDGARTAGIRGAAATGSSPASLPGDGARGAGNAGPVAMPEGSEVTVRVVLGPQEEAFEPSAVEQFLETAFEISTDADRMGYRLAGQTLRHRGAGEILSDGIALGSIQVPPHGHPIVMLADRPSVGGYPKIATVISADVRLVAQCRPGMKLRFREVSLEKAWQAAKTLGRTAEGADRLPVDQVRELLAAMRRAGSTHASLETAGLKLRLERGSPES